jgi:hypothetical protein
MLSEGEKREKEEKKGRKRRRRSCLDVLVLRHFFFSVIYGETNVRSHGGRVVREEKRQKEERWKRKRRRKKRGGMVDRRIFLQVQGLSVKFFCQSIYNLE